MCGVTIDLLPQRDITGDDEVTHVKPFDNLVVRDIKTRFDLNQVDVT